MALFDVIEYEGSGEVLIHRAAQTDFNTHSTLVVRESQKAILIRNGQLADIFDPGRYVLHTQNIPILSKLVNLPTGGVSPFQCEVYFINQAISLNRKWGTSSQARVYDHTYDLILTIGANGAMGLRVRDPRQVLLSVVGTEPDLTGDQFLDYFRDTISMKIKEYIARVMQRPEIDFMVLDANLSEFSNQAKALLNEELAEYGVEICNFSISNIQIPDEQYEAVLVMQNKRHLQRQREFEMKGDLNLQMMKAQGDRASLMVDAQGENERRKLQALTDVEIANLQIDVDAHRTERMAQAEARARAAQGYNWADQQQAEVAKLYAASGSLQNNPANMLAQAPMALAFGDLLRDNVEPVMNPNYSNPGMNFGNGFPGQSGGEQHSPSGGFGAPEDFSLGIEPVDPTTPADPTAPEAPAEPAVAAVCPNCGASLAGSPKFCPECGTRLAPAEPVRCGCGHLFGPKEKFCPECGSPRTGV